MYGLRVSLLVGVAAALTATVVGTAVGATAGALGGWVDRAVMRVVDTIASVPHLLLGIFIVAMFRPGVWPVVISVALTHWLSTARIVRAEVLSLRSRPYIDAAVSGGASRWQVAVRHLLPGVLPQAALAAVLMVPHAMWHESALSFLGLGLPTHTASLGNPDPGGAGDRCSPGSGGRPSSPACSSSSPPSPSPVSRVPGEADQPPPPIGADAVTERAPVLSVRGLSVRFLMPGGRRVAAVTDAHFDVAAGECLALIGESGCGKSVLASALLGLLPGNARTAGSALLGELDLLAADERTFARTVRGRLMASSRRVRPLTSPRSAPSAPSWRRRSRHTPRSGRPWGPARGRGKPPPSAPRSRWTTSTTTRTSSPAVSPSAPPPPSPWSVTPHCCSPTNRPPDSTGTWWTAPSTS